MGEVAGGEGLDGRLHQLPDAAQVGRRLGQVASLEARTEIAAIETEAALVGLAGADEARRGECRGLEPGGGGPAGMDALGPAAVLEELEAARCEAERDALGLAHLGRGEIQELAGDQRARESADHPGGMEAGGMELAARGLAEPRGHLDAEDIGRQQALEIGAGELGGREGRGKGAGRRMDDCAQVGVIEVQAVAEQPIEGCGIAWCQATR